jgi:hypothetical protein
MAKNPKQGLRIKQQMLFMFSPYDYEHFYSNLNLLDLVRLLVAFLSGA